ncbi:hypothetical protein K402DRAFT_406355 [Aulographum hederae CBS 113979]|uniref:Mediator of RNA polymerase II transcription subunit 11 n=1 Tax=Aulographum hederae CBS 113979 TaxID=1176131 RepID=A0A6G1GTM6_9PEZI|nr:hypothetical protein K402DRAFT_406355 [Aulographum hederae CBS 113979]
MESSDQQKHDAKASRSERIHTLNTINEDIPALLAAASAAISTLTNRPSIPPREKAPPKEDLTDLTGGPVDEFSSTPPLPDSQALRSRKLAFLQHSHSFWTITSSVAERLLAEATLLEEAGLAAPPSTRALDEERRAREREQKIRNGGMGDMDVGYLNSRAGNAGMSVEKEGEVLREIGGLLEKALERKEGKQGDEMEVEQSKE